MSSEREAKLAKLLVEYSVELKKGEKCLINAIDIPTSMTEELIKAVYAVGGIPVVNVWSERLERAMVQDATKESLDVWAGVDCYRMKQMDAFIGIRGIANVRETASIQDKVGLYAKYYNDPVHMKIRLPYTKWVVLRYPTEAFAMQANMGTRDFEEYFYKVCTEVDYKKMNAVMLEAKKFLETVDKVRIVSPGTDLTFSVKGLPWIPCAGKMNIPDGEIYSAPVKNSVNGTISYNTVSTYHGHCFSNIVFKFKDGKIVEAHSDNDELINDVLNTDEGSRYVGEFALGCNPQVTFPIDNILFDEKIAGSIHFTPGNSYDDCDNGNKSANHWDLVLIQTPAYGGGEIYMDDVLVRKDGVFIHPALKALNGQW